MNGIIEGAKEFLVAGYVLTWIVLLGYSFSLIFRHKKVSLRGTK